LSYHEKVFFIPKQAQFLLRHFSDNWTTNNKRSFLQIIKIADIALNYYSNFYHKSSIFWCHEFIINDKKFLCMQYVTFWSNKLLHKMLIVFESYNILQLSLFLAFFFLFQYTRNLNAKSVLILKINIFTFATT